MVRLRKQNHAQECITLQQIREKLQASKLDRQLNVPYGNILPFVRTKKNAQTQTFVDRNSSLNQQMLSTLDS
jgi:hypothetical protein